MSQLKLSQVKKQYTQIHKQEKYELKDGSTITFTPIFPHGDIEKLIEHLATQFKYAEEKGFELTDKFIQSYVLFLCIRQFTHLGKEISDNFEEQIQQMNWLIDTGYFKEIVEEVFLKEEIGKLFEKMVEVSGNYLFLEKLTQQMQNHVAKLELQNKDILKKINVEDNTQ
ncbi:hypothetical protein JK635_01855 [Neobacillus sp. YIM B02564]|uniref:Uncharacterized protein n=1 Tax=Neobacillus paridis TaxID=2803862 RepID=A0ABS1TKD4_9BACI|nr:hypothetical protein [Neobacillus paridis]MBL4950983.1 hypothetical protein [Neobacillus paridis]